MPRTRERPSLYLIDGSSYIFRAYYAIPHLSTRKGEPTNAVLGFTNMLLKTLREGDPTHVAVAFDTKVPTFRHDLYAEYKANRLEPPDDLKPQFGRIHEVVEAMNLPLIRKEGWEADDLIGTLALKAHDRGWDVVIVTGDKDFMQLVRPGIRLYDGMRDRWTDEPEVIEKFGVPPERVTDVLALMGDSSDNVPGVRGIGEKTAGPLIAQFGSLESLLDNIDTLKSKSQQKKLTEGAESARLSKQLVIIDTDSPVGVELDQLVTPAADTDRLRALFTELEFTKLVQELAPSELLSKEHYDCVTVTSDLDALLARLRDAKVFAVDTQTTGLDPMRAQLVGLAFCVEPGRAWYVPMGHVYLGAPKQLPPLQVLEAIRSLLEDPERPKIAQHSKYDYLVLRRHGITLRGVTADPLLLDYLLDPGKNSSLDALAQSELGHTSTTFAQLAGKGKHQRTFDQIPLEEATPYACEDADVTLRLAERLAPRVESAGLTKLFEELEQPLSIVLAEMELAGVKVDTALLDELSVEFGERMKRCEEEVYELAGRTFTIHSTRQLADVLFQHLALPVIKRTKTGPSTDVSVLEELAGLHPLPGCILEYRRISKLKSTYVDTLPKLVHPETGRIHTSFSQTTAATGRLASSDPNLQNIPIRTEDGRRIRQAFTAEPGHLLVSADYSQIELRILAHLAEDDAFAAAFREDQDIHARTASELLGMPLDAVDPDARRIAKAINFGIVYGMSAFRLARDLGIERQEAQSYIDGYFARHQGVKSWLDRTVAQAHTDGFVTTLFGRRRLLPDLYSKNHNVRAGAERTAINTPIQGTAADIIKMAMLEVHAGLPAVSEGSRMILQVHDELLLETPEADVRRVTDWLRQTMEDVYRFSVPLRVDVGSGRTWGDAH